MWIARGSRLEHLGLSGRKLDGWPDGTAFQRFHFSNSNLGNFVLFFPGVPWCVFPEIADGSQGETSTLASLPYQ